MLVYTEFACILALIYTGFAYFLKEMYRERQVSRIPCCWMT